MIGNFIHGWAIFFYLYRTQRKKKHGTGKRALIPAIYFAQCGRHLVDGQHRGAPGPNLRVYNRIGKLLGSA